METKMSNNIALRELDLSRRQREVFNTIKQIGCVTAKGIAYSQNLSINSITGRIKELMDKNAIKIAYTGKDYYKSKRKVNYYTVKNICKQGK